MRGARVGFTGTRRPLTEEQREALWRMFEWLGPRELHHGGCVGADEAVNSLALDMNRGQDSQDVIITVWPGVNEVGESPYRFSTAGLGVWVEGPRPYLVRNKKIVDLTEVLIACPDSKTERLRSGTWFTVRYARSKGKPVILIFPDGTISQDQPVRINKEEE